jgi:hypothetical protein
MTRLPVGVGCELFELQTGECLGVTASRSIELAERISALLYAQLVRGLPLLVLTVPLTSPTKAGGRGTDVV